MNLPPATTRQAARVRAFTLIELLFVTLIIGILAALLLPVVSKGKVRARQVDCLNNLKQVGVASHAFAHDHGDGFPFQVSMRDGGTLEFVQASLRQNSDASSAFRHFQALSNELTFPKPLICPADIRTNAPTFQTLDNENISYFVAVTADYTKPDTLLSGDRSMISPGGDSGSILRLGRQTPVGWARGGHEYRGNLLFADGHLENTDSATLQKLVSGFQTPVSVWNPVAKPTTSGSASSGGSSGGGAGSSPTGSGGNGSGSGGGAASGFAALQTVFQTAPDKPASPSSPPPEAPSTPAVAAKPAAPAVAENPPMAAAPEPAPKPATKSPSMANPPPVLEDAPVASKDLRTEPEPTVLVFFVEPERCWPCWIVFIVLSLLGAFVLGVMVHRRRQARRRAAE